MTHPITTNLTPCALAYAAPRLAVADFTQRFVAGMPYALIAGRIIRIALAKTRTNPVTTLFFLRTGALTAVRLRVAAFTRPAIAFFTTPCAPVASVPHELQSALTFLRNEPAFTTISFCIHAQSRRTFCRVCPRLSSTTA